MKPMDFEEWYKKPEAYTTRDVWIAARIGMIPEDEAVRIPPASEWPRHATGINVTYTWDCLDEAVGNPIIKHIIRPIHAWIPEVGGKVFVDSRSIRVGIVSAMEKASAFVNVGSCSLWWQFDDCKPFHESHIGKPWDEIPGGGK